jgi:prefoldin subunit 5
MIRQAFAIVALGVFCCVGAHAQTARSGGNANAQLMQQMQQLASERTSLQAENEKLKQQLDQLKKQLNGAKSGTQAVTLRAQEEAAALAHSNEQRASTEAELAKTKEQIQQLVAKFRETIQTLRTAETESTTTKQALAMRDRELKSCVDHNEALYKLDDEVLTRLEKQGLWSRVAEAEPFTRIKRSQLENFIDDSRVQAKGQRVVPSASSSTPPSSTSSTPPATPAAPQTPDASTSSRD